MSSASPNEHERPDTVLVNDPHRALPAHASSDAGKPKGSPLRLILVIVVVLAAAGGAAWLIRKNSAEMAQANQRQAAALDRAIPVQAATVQQKTMPIYLTALGSVTAYNTVTIKSRVDGQLLRVNFIEGQGVKQGDLLLQIDPSPYEATLAQAEGQLARDQANANNAQAEAQRYNALYEANVVSRESRDTQISTAGMAAGVLKADQAAIQAAKVNLAYTRITAPINGIIGLRQVDPGNIVHSGDSTGLLVITQVRPISVIFTIPEDQLPQVVQLHRGGRKLVVEAWDRSNSAKIATGTLLTVDNQIDQTTGTVKLKAVFPNNDAALFPNQFVNVRLILQDRPNAVVAPSAAIQTGNQGTFVFQVHPGDPPPELAGPAGGGGGGGRRGGGGGNAGGGNGGGGNAGGGRGGGRGGRGGGGGGADAGTPGWVETKPVKVGVNEGAEVIIDSGLNPGDQIVIDGQEKLRNGSRVTVTRPAGSGNNPGNGANAGAGAGAGNQTGSGPSGGGGRRRGQSDSAPSGQPSGDGASGPAGGRQGRSNGGNGDGRNGRRGGGQSQQQ